jgi:hypothetical protein
MMPGVSAMLRRSGLAILLTAAPSCGAAVFQESFATNPSAHGWRTFGDASLFAWSAANQNLEITWDSSRLNSFFYLPLGTIVTKSDDFSFSFDVRLRDIRLGNTPAKTNEFEIAVGLLNYTSAINTNAFRGAGQSATYGVRNLVEFDYFPDAGFGETFATTVVSTNNRIYPAHNFPLAMTPGDTFRITFRYSASNQLLRTAVTKNGSPFGLPPDNTLADLSLIGKQDFRVDSFAIISYSDAIQTGPPAFHGSVLAHGFVDNVQITVPPPPVADLRLNLSHSVWSANFISATNWTYVLERSADLVSWTVTSPVVFGNGDSLSLQDVDQPASKAFYRIRADRP